MRLVLTCSKSSNLSLTQTLEWPGKPPEFPQVEEVDDHNHARAHDNLCHIRLFSLQHGDKSDRQEVSCLF